MSKLYDIYALQVTWVFLANSMCNQLFEIDICMYNVSSLKQLVFDSKINDNIHEKLITYFKNISIVQIYSMYNFNQLSNNSNTLS